MAIPAPKVRAMMVSRAKPRTRETMVIELTAASDLSRFIERVVRLGKGWTIKPAIYAILRAAKTPEAKAASLQVTGRK
ncbi:hypothetical protein ALQ46_102331 [Pseudomonas savastanoi pv. phaseolicola]|nr:hypothetical protein ALQ46_102331 [Pseudomonas savastanoi pv. phaseolicola]